MNPHDQLIAAAKSVQGEFVLRKDYTAGSVGAALLTAGGALYTGICLDLACGIGFCAEHSAIAEMLKQRETRIEWIVAVGKRDEILPPCGRCRELLMQINPENVATRIITGAAESRPLHELLPDYWL